MTFVHEVTQCTKVIFILKQEQMFLKSYMCCDRIDTNIGSIPERS